MIATEWGKSVRVSLAGIGLATLAGLVNSAIYISSYLADNIYTFKSRDFIKLTQTLVNELSAAYAFLLLLPLLLLFFKKFQLKKDNWLVYLPLYIMATILLSATHTSFMYYSRVLLYKLLKLGEFNYGYIPIRIIMEYLKQTGVFWHVYIIYAWRKAGKDRQQELLRASDLERQLAQTRLQVLKMQLNPHFLFNTLNMISSIMYEDIETADKMLATLSDLLRKTFREFPANLTPLSAEIELLNLYLDLMSARFKDQLTVSIRVDKEAEKALVPIFLLQPLVENSIVHGMQETIKLKIEISAERQADTLQIFIKDNGPGLPKDFDPIQSSGVGLRNTVERLEQLIGEKCTFELIKCEVRGLLIIINIPFYIQEADIVDSFSSR